MKKIAQNRDETSLCTDEGAILREEGTILTKVDACTNGIAAYSDKKSVSARR